MTEQALALLMVGLFLFVPLLPWILVGLITAVEKIFNRPQKSALDVKRYWVDLARPSGSIPARVKLTDDEQAELEQLQDEEKEIVDTIAACRRNMATRTAAWDIEYYQDRIKALNDNLTAKRAEIKALTTGSNRPENHQHSALIPVESGGNVVAWICGTCEAQLDETDPAVKLWIEAGVKRAQEIAERARVDEAWNGLFRTPELEEQRREEATLRQELNQGNWDPERARRHKEIVDRLLSDPVLKEQIREYGRKRVQGR